MRPQGHSLGSPALNQKEKSILDVWLVIKVTPFFVGKTTNFTIQQGVSRDYDRILHRKQIFLDQSLSTNHDPLYASMS